MAAIPHSIISNRTVSASDFRTAMRHLTGGVSVITAGRGPDISGMTVTSVTSLSVDPPTVMVSINRDASSFPLLRRYGSFGVNILNADQLRIAERFAGKGAAKGADRFVGAEWTPAASSVPLLSGALAALECDVDEIIERYSHGIVIGVVKAIRVAVRQAALGYWHGEYVSIDQSLDDRGRQSPTLAAVGNTGRDRARMIADEDS
jgi:flavin reductase (DIM6/NTAB) family NADH-FMN oxidoreductase RutF